MKKKTIAVLFGGQSTEHEVSRLSAATIISNIDPDNYYVIPVGITKTGKWMIYQGPVENLKSGEWERFGIPAVISPDATQRGLIKVVGGKAKVIPVDVVFPVLHGAWGEDGTVQGLLELSRIPYVGCGVLSSAVCMDKLFTKMVAKANHINQAEYMGLYADELSALPKVIKRIERKIGYPCFVKPANAGSSVGISKAKTPEELDAALKLAALYDEKLVVEKAVSGRELEIAVLGDRKKVMTSGVGEILPAAEFYDYDSKYNDENSKTIVGPDLPEGKAEEIKKTAEKIYRAVDGRGLARVDFFLEHGTDRVIFNEINTMPGFTSISMFPMLMAAEGVSISQQIDKLIEIALWADGGSHE